MAKKHPDHVWLALRSKWEMTNDISFADLAKFVQNFLDCDVPSATTISRRAKAEKWAKIHDSIASKSTRAINSFIKKMVADCINKEEENQFQADEIINENRKFDNTEKCTKSTKKNDRVMHEITQAKKLSKKRESARLTSSRVIKDVRSMNAKSRNMIDEIMDSFIHLANEVKKIDLDAIGDFSAEEVEGLSPKEVLLYRREKEEMFIKKLNYKLHILREMSIIAGSLNMSVSMNTKTATDVWGLDEENLKDTEEIDSQRSAAIDQSKKKLEALKIAKAKEQALKGRSERLQRISDHIATHGDYIEGESVLEGEEE